MDTPQPFERRRGALVMRPLSEWYAHQEFLRLRHCIGARVTTNGVGYPHDACPHHAVDITAVTPA